MGMMTRTVRQRDETIILAQQLTRRLVSGYCKPHDILLRQRHSAVHTPRVIGISIREEDCLELAKVKTRRAPLSEPGFLERLHEPRKPGLKVHVIGED